MEFRRPPSPPSDKKAYPHAISHIKSNKNQPNKNNNKLNQTFTEPIYFHLFHTIQNTHTQKQKQQIKTEINNME